MPRSTRLTLLVTMLALAVIGLRAIPVLFGASAPPLPAEDPAPGPATIESLTIMPAGSSSAAVTVIIRGTLPDDCTAIEAVRPGRVAAGFQLEITTRRLVPDEGGAGCLMVRLPFQHLVRLDTAGLPAGVYTVAAAGQRVEFRQPAGPAAPSTLAAAH